MARHISVIIPLRNSGKNINTLLAGLVSQDHPDFDIYLVGGKDDKTWQAIEQQFLNWGGLSLTAEPVTYDQPELLSPNAVAVTHWSGVRLHIVEVELIAGWRGRDSNVKRNVGARLSNGEWVAVSDAKIIRDDTWLSQGLQIAARQKVQSVAGIMIGTQESALTFFGMLADKGIVIRNPKFGTGRLLTWANFGKSESLPITANWMMTREYYELMDGFDENFRISYEDYASAGRLVSNGGVIFCTSEWVVWHKHRTEFRQVYLEYVRSGRGAGQLRYAYPDNPYGRRRFRQSFSVLLGAIFLSGLLLYALLYASTNLLPALMLIGFVGITMIGYLNYRKAGHWWGFFFPLFTAFFIFVFSYNFMYQYIIKGDPEKVLQTIWSMTYR